MLKKICGLFLGLVVIAGSACVTPTRASSAEIIITHIQPAGITGALDEFVAIYNNSETETDVTGWCLANKSGNDFACLPSSEGVGNEPYFLPAYSYITFGSEEFISNFEEGELAVSKIYTVTSQSSGSIVSSNDKILLLNANKDIIDEKSWSTALPSSKLFERIKLSEQPDVYQKTQTEADWLAVDSPEDYVSGEVINPSGNEDGSGSDDGDNDNSGNDSDDSGSDNDNGNNNANLEPVITELFPNPRGADGGQEFIELYNPNPSLAVSLDGLRIKIGVNSPKWHDLPANVVIEPLSYRVISQSEVSYTLVNTIGSAQLYRELLPVGAEVQYSSAPDGQAWALIGDLWQYTNRITPGEQNKSSTLGSDAVLAPKAKTSTPKPCEDNQFRNPETGRCKLLSSVKSGSLKPCKPGQERNPETNRCRSIAGAIKTLTPCKEGQERSLETNRCRNIVKMTKADHSVKGVETRNESGSIWYVWLAIAGIGAAVISYAAWEWRQELKSGYEFVRTKFTKKPR